MSQYQTREDYQVHLQEEANRHLNAIKQIGLAVLIILVLLLILAVVA